MVSAYSAGRLFAGLPWPSGGVNASRPVVVTLRPDGPGERTARVLAGLERVEHGTEVVPGRQPSSARAQVLTYTRPMDGNIRQPRRAYSAS